MKAVKDELIYEVSLRPQLFNKKLSEFRDRNLKEELWKEIGQILDKSSNDCETRWKSLRERFTRELKKQNNPSGSGAVEPSSWIYYKQMLFLKDHIAPRKTTWNTFEPHTSTMSNIFIPESDTFDMSIGNFEDNVASPTPTSTSLSNNSRNDKFNELCVKLQNKIEDISPSVNEQFMKTVMLLMADLPPRVQEEARAKIFQTITELRLKHIYAESVHK